jgi:cysteine desulfurase/selenocysteine lyase
MLQKYRLGYLKNLSESEMQIKMLRHDFPILNTLVNGSNLIWFDNGATTQKPSKVINVMKEYSEKYNANVHRSPHNLSKVSSEMFEGARMLIARYINSTSEDEIVFTKGTTEGINLLVNSFAYDLIRKKLAVTVLITEMEHHANIVPWHILQKKMPFNLDYIEFEDDGKIDLDKLESKFKSNSTIRIFSVTHISNVLGTINPIKEMCKLAHKYGVYVIVDGAQGIPLRKVDVLDLDCDFYTFSSHKLFGPTGVGVVYGKKDLLDAMPVWQGGGSMIEDVQLLHSSYRKAPIKFEPGTPAITEVIGLGETIRYLNKLDWAVLESYESKLMLYMHQKLKGIPGIVILGDTVKDRAPIFSFVIKDIDSNKLLEALDKNGVAVRYGHHCSQPTVRHYGYEEVIRFSLAWYNTYNEIDKAINIVKLHINESLKSK